MQSQSDGFIQGASRSSTLLCNTISSSNLGVEKTLVFRQENAVK